MSLWSRSIMGAMLWTILGAGFLVADLLLIFYGISRKGMPIPFWIGAFFGLVASVNLLYFYGIRGLKSKENPPKNFK